MGGNYYRPVFGYGAGRRETRGCVGIHICEYCSHHITYSPSHELQWANTVISSCPVVLADKLSTQLGTLAVCIDEVSSAYLAPQPHLSLLPRPALYLFSHATSALHLLEHAIWAYDAGEPTAGVDIEVFRRWVDESGLESSLQDVRRVKVASPEREYLDAQIVYGKAESGVPPHIDSASARL